MNHLQSALDALLAEEKSLSAQIVTLQRKLADIQAAIAPVAKLVNGQSPEELSREESDAALRKLYVTPARKANLANLTMPEAIKQVLKQSSIPLKAADVARELTEGGFVSKSDDLPNLVGTTLRRLREKEEVQQDEEKRWAISLA